METKEFKKGDLVKVKKNLKPGREYGGVFVAPRMINFCGCVATIKEVSSEGFILKNASRYTFSAEMLKHFEYKRRFKKGDLVKVVNRPEYEGIQTIEKVFFEGYTLEKFPNTLFYNDQLHKVGGLSPELKAAFKAYKKLVIKYSALIGTFGLHQYSIYQTFEGVFEIERTSCADQVLLKFENIQTAQNFLDENKELFETAKPLL